MNLHQQSRRLNRWKSSNKQISLLLSRSLLYSILNILSESPPVIKKIYWFSIIYIANRKVRRTDHLNPRYFLFGLFSSSLNTSIGLMISILFQPNIQLYCHWCLIYCAQIENLCDWIIWYESFLDQIDDVEDEIKLWISALHRFHDLMVYSFKCPNHLLFSMQITKWHNKKCYQFYFLLDDLERRACRNRRTTERGEGWNWMKRDLQTQSRMET